MNFRWNERSGSVQKFALGLLGVAILCGFAASRTVAQSAAPALKSDPNPARSDVNPTQTFYLSNSVGNDAQDVVTALRNMLTPTDRIWMDQSQNAVIMQAPPDQLLLAQKIIGDIDRPRKTYRLTYTITEFDAGKRVGTQHFALVLVSGQRTTLKQGSKVPVVTGSYDSGKASTQTQFTYLDVGINIESTLDDSPNEIRLKSKVEQSSIADSTAIMDVKEPIIRQSVLEGTSLLTIGKPLILGGLDISGSTRHLDIEAVVEIVK